MQIRAKRACAQPPGRMRRLLLEALEDRQLLTATGLADAPNALPWHNPVYRLDVNNDGATTPLDVVAVVGRILSSGTGDLPDPGPNPPEFYYDTSGDNRLTPIDLLNIVNGLLAKPQVVVSSLTPLTSDVTPLVMVSATDTSGVPDGSVVSLDVDLNNDGDFGDPGELNYTQSTIFAGSATFPIKPGLPRTSELYHVNLRARVRDDDAVAGTSKVLPLEVDLRTSTALEDYVASHTSAVTTLRNTVAVPTQGYTFYAYDLETDAWRSEADLDRPVWHHWLQIYVPAVVTSSTALMLIDGGSNHDDEVPQPPGVNEPVNLGSLAALTGSIIVHLPTVPNEPLQFTDDEGTRSEDRIIAYSFDKFLNGIGEPGNETWPVLLPMVNSAVRAMDAAQAVQPVIEDFVVTGYSKRGWTTWLTAAVDDRVRAIMPGVFDNLNQGPQMVHHYGAYGFFANHVAPYSEMQIFERLLTTEAQELSPITDPYRYLNNGRFDDMPKLLINSAGDEFFVPDSAQFYFDDIPGEQNYLRYLPNTGHDLGLATNPQEVVNTTLGFYVAVLAGAPLPQYSWTVSQDGAIHVQTPQNPIAVKLWQATNPAARDFRHNFHPEIVWTSEGLVKQGTEYVANVAMPQQGATAYFVELTFPSFLPQLPNFVFTTEIRVKSTLPFAPWPYEIDDFDAAGALAGAFVSSSPLAAAAEASTAGVAQALAARSAAPATPRDLALVELSEPPTDVEPAAVVAEPACTVLEAPGAIDEGDTQRAAEPVDDTLTAALDEMLS